MRVDRVELNVDERERRLAQNEALFREVNERVETLADRFGPNVPYEFLCECANPLCNATFEMSGHDLQTLHTTPGCYVVLAGHDVPDLEDVVQSQNGYAIVRKRAAER